MVETTVAIPGPESITRQELDNGITVLAYENFLSPSVVVQGYLRVGSVDDPLEQAGLANFTAAMLDQGTKTRTFAAISEAVESVGATLGVSARLHITGFSIKCLVEDLDRLLDILADVLRNPTFPEKETEKVRGQILTSIQERDNDTRSVAGLVFRKLAYPDHPYGRSGRGYTETVSAIGRDDLRAFHERYYRPQGMGVAIVGALSAREAVEKVAAALGDWQPGDSRPPQEIPEVPELRESRREFREMPDKSQTDIVLGAPGISRLDPDYHAAKLANTVLGVFGMMGRLGDNVRDRQGLAYYVYSHLEAHLGRGPWMAATGVNPTNVQRAIDSILAEIHRMQDEPVPEEELEDSKSYLTGSLPLRLETNGGIAQALLDMEFYDLGLDYLQRYPGIINALTPGEVQRVAQRVFPRDVYALAIAGPPVSDQ